MNLDTLRFRIVPDGTFALTCVRCGHVGLVLAAEDLDRTPLSSIVAFGEHACRIVEPPAAAPPATERPGPTADPQMRRFVAERLARDPLAFVLMDDAMEAFDQMTGGYVAAGSFGRRLRAALPPWAEVRRERIAGDRARRIVGARLKQ